MNGTRPPRRGIAGGLVCACGCLAATFAAGGAARAQVIHGSIRTQEQQVYVPGVKVTVVDSLGKPLGEAVTDAAGKFTLVLNATAAFQLSVFKVGWAPSSTDWIHAARTDTLEYDLFVPADPTELAPVNVTGQKTFNDLAFDEAKRRGWKVYPPQLIEEHRNKALNFADLMRDVGVTSIRIGRSNECTRSNLTGRCLVYVVDGQVAGQFIYISPRDVYFIAVLSATESAVQYGDRAPWGAIVVYTHQYGEKKNP